MNPWLLFILVVIIVHFLVDTIISLLNLKALSPELPEEFSDTFDQHKYRRSQTYTKVRTKFSIVENSVTTMITLSFLLAGGFNSVDTVVRSFAADSITAGLCYAIALMVLSFLVGLPFDIYSTFVIESRFDFNRTTAKTYILDIVKGAALSLVVGVPMLTLILWFFEHAGAFGWLFCWIGVVVIGFVVQFLSPILIMPLFNTFTPLEDGLLKDKILSYARRENFTMSGIFTMDGSKRSTKLNAFFTGFGRFRKIVFFDTLLEKVEDDEVVAVLAHEMGHFKKKHIWKMMAAHILQTGLMFYLLSLFLNNPGLFEAFRMERISIYASLFFFAFLYSPINTLVSISFNLLSRSHEYEADRYAAETTGKPEALIRSLKKLSLANLANLTPHPAMVVYSYSHPPILARIKALRSLQAK